MSPENIGVERPSERHVPTQSEDDTQNMHALSKLRAPISKKTSPLFEGATLFQQMNKSAFGHFDAAIRSITEHVPLMSFTLPKVIVIGGKSAGKSSLLENITKCAIFPRAYNLCTKRPIKLQLQQVRSAEDFSVCVLYDGKRTKLTSTDDILGTVEAIMKPLECVSDQEIVVRICQVDVPTIELVDLPGIQLYPPNLERETTSLVNKYLSAPDTLVLCVVDATIPSLDSSPAVKMIREADKLSSTILALTKADLVKDEEVIVAHIFDRILRQSSEIQELPDLAGCVAVINRKHSDQLSLLEAETAETATFDSLFQDPAQAYASAEVQAQLKENTTSSQLIAKLDTLFHDHIQKQWMPAALRSIRKTMSSVRKDCIKLGPAPENLKLEEVLKVLIAKAAVVSNEALASTSIHVPEINTKDGLKSCALPYLDTVISAQNLQWGSHEWTASSNALHSLVKGAVSIALADSTYLTIVQNVFSTAFTSNHPWKLARFASLNDALWHSVLPVITATALTACKPIIDSMVDSAFSQNCHQIFPTHTFASLDRRICGCILQQLQAATTNPAQMIKQAPEADKLQLREDAMTAARRSALRSTLAQLQAAHSTIKGIASPQGTAMPPQPTSRECFDLAASHDAAAAAELAALVPSVAFRFKWPIIMTAAPSEDIGFAATTDATPPDASVSDEEVWTPEHDAKRSKPKKQREVKKKVKKERFTAN